MATQKLAVAALLSALAGVAAAQTNGTCPPPIRPAISTPEHLVQFADDVDKGHRRQNQDHGALTLRSQSARDQARRAGARQAGEILLVNFENENPLFGVDGVPFLAPATPNR